MQQNFNTFEMYVNEFRQKANRNQGYLDLCITTLHLCNPADNSLNSSTLIDKLFASLFSTLSFLGKQIPSNPNGM